MTEPIRAATPEELAAFDKKGAVNMTPRELAMFRLAKREEHKRQQAEREESRAALLPSIGEARRAVEEARLAEIPAKNAIAAALPDLGAAFAAYLDWRRAKWATWDAQLKLDRLDRAYRGEGVSPARFRPSGGYVKTFDEVLHEAIDDHVEAERKAEQEPQT